MKLLYLFLFLVLAATVSGLMMDLNMTFMPHLDGRLDLNATSYAYTVRINATCVIFDGVEYCGGPLDHQFVSVTTTTTSSTTTTTIPSGRTHVIMLYWSWLT